MKCKVCGSSRIQTEKLEGQRDPTCGNCQHGDCDYGHTKVVGWRCADCGDHVEAEVVL
jgi:hypothetical protein